MNSREWNEALNHLDSDLVEEYIAKKDNKKPGRFYWLATVAAVLVLTIGIGTLAGQGILPTNPPSLETLPATEPSIPTTAAPTQPVVTNPATIAPTQPVVTNPATIAPTRPVVTNPPTTPPQEPVIVPLNNLVAEPTYPVMMKYPDPKDYVQAGNRAFEKAVSEWERARPNQYRQPDGYANSLTDYFQKSINQFLQGDGNQVYSPLNVYLAMAMLAETAEGNSRQQILDLFGLDTIEQLREQVDNLWNAHYCDDGVTSTLLANSLWLDDSYSYNQETVQLLADRYYASTFNGDLGTNAMNQQLQSWLNENTGGMLTEQANNVHMDAKTVVAIASTVYFTASWEYKFSAKNTKDALFHAADVDIKVPFMNTRKLNYAYYWGENFGAVELELTGNNSMWLILPDEGYTTADIMASDDYLQMTLNPKAWENQRKLDINLSVPKFDVVEQQNLVSGMQAMGVRDVFDPIAADFDFVTDEIPAWVDEINHATRVVIDEEGCKGAAFTVIFKAGMALPPEVDEIDFVLDRPFLFVVSSQDNLPLFAGVVNNP